MPISKQFCKSQIERFEGLPYYGSIGQNGFVELVNALQIVSKTEEIAALLVTGILMDRTRAMNPATNRVPTPGELNDWAYRIMEDISMRPVRETRDAKCRRCDGTGRFTPVDLNKMWGQPPGVPAQYLPEEECSICEGTGKR